MLSIRVDIPADPLVSSEFKVAKALNKLLKIRVANIDILEATERNCDVVCVPVCSFNSVQPEIRISILKRPSYGSEVTQKLARIAEETVVEMYMEQGLPLGHVRVFVDFYDLQCGYYVGKS